MCIFIYICNCICILQFTAVFKLVPKFEHGGDSPVNGHFGNLAGKLDNEHKAW